MNLSRRCSRCTLHALTCVTANSGAPPVPRRASPGCPYTSVTALSHGCLEFLAWSMMKLRGLASAKYFCWSFLASFSVVQSLVHRVRLILDLGLVNLSNNSITARHLHMKNASSAWELDEAGESGGRGGAHRAVPKPPPLLRWEKRRQKSGREEGMSLIFFIFLARVFFT